MKRLKCVARVNGSNGEYRILVGVQNMKTVEDLVNMIISQYIQDPVVS